MKKRLSQSILSTVLIPCLIILLFLCSSCRPDSVENDPFFQLYQPDLSTISSSSVSSVSDPSSLSLSANLMPFPVFSRVLSDKFDVGVVFSQSLQTKSITAEFKNTSLSDVINVISRQLDVGVVKVGNTYYIGKLRPEDRAILVRKVLGFSNQDLIKACQGVISDKGKVSVIGAGVVSATDQSSVLQRLTELLDYLSSLHEPVWIVQLAFLTLNREILLEGGVKVSTSGTISYNVSDNEFSLKDINIDGIINAAMSSSFADVHSCPMLLVREGSTSEWKYGRRVPVPKKTTSSYGTVQTTGFDYIDVGFNVKASVSRSRAGGILSLQIGKSEIESYVEFAPVTAQNTYNFLVEMAPLRPYLLGELQTFTDLNKQSDILNFGKTRGKSSVQVWGQLYRITPGVSRSFPLKLSNNKSGQSAVKK